jgi:ATP-dependent Clp protease ATP-binding subunit ClpX
MDLSDVQQKDLVRFGLIPELIGRLPIITALNPLSENDLVRILTEPKNALTKQYQELLAMDGVKLEFETDALKRIAELAIKKEIGARGLRSIIEKSMQKVMFSIPDRTDAKKVVVTSGVIDGIEEAVVLGSRNKKIA